MWTSGATFTNTSCTFTDLANLNNVFCFVQFGPLQARFWPGKVTRSFGNQFQHTRLHQYFLYNPIKTATHSCTNPGAGFDSDISMRHHVNMLCKIGFYHLRNIARIRKCLGYDAVQTIIHSLISARLDYCNSLLAGVPIFFASKGGICTELSS